MRLKKRSNNQNLLTRGLDRLALEGGSLDSSPSPPTPNPQPTKIQTKQVRFTNDKPAIIHDSKPIDVKERIGRRGPKKDALIDTTKLLSI